MCNAVCRQPAQIWWVLDDSVAWDCMSVGIKTESRRLFMPNLWCYSCHVPLQPALLWRYMKFTTWLRNIRCRPCQRFCSRQEIILPLHPSSVLETRLPSFINQECTTSCLPTMHQPKCQLAFLFVFSGSKHSGWSRFSFNNSILCPLITCFKTNKRFETKTPDKTLHEKPSKNQRNEKVVSSGAGSRTAFVQETSQGRMAFCDSEPRFMTISDSTTSILRPL